MSVAKRPSKLQISFLCLIVTIGAAVRVYHLDAVGIWNDEAASITLACGHWQSLFDPPSGYFQHPPDLMSSAGMQPVHELFFEADSTPPLYSFVLRGWWAMFGMGDVSCRMLSVVVSTLAIFVVFDIARLIAGPTCGIWAALLMAASPTELRLAQEARCYAMLVLLGACACDAVLRLRLLGPTRKRWVAAAVFISLVTLTHYYVLAAVMGIALFAVVELRGRSRNILITIVGGALLLLMATRLPIVIHHMETTRYSVHWLDDPRKGLIGRTIVRAASVPAWLILAPRDDAMVSGTPAVLLILLPFFLDRLRPGLMLCGIWSAGVIGLVAISDVALGHSALLYVRYTLAATPGVVVSLVVIADLGGKWLRHLLPALAVLGAMLAVPSVYQDEFWQKTESQKWAGEIKSSVRAGDMLVIYSRPNMGLYAAGSEYLYAAHYAWPFPCAVAVIEGTASAEIRDKIWSHPRVWVAACYYSGIGDALGPCRVVHEGLNYFGAGRLLRVEPVIAAAQPNASRHST